MGRKGKLFVLSGPSGVGKGTVKSRLFEEFPDSLVFSVSATTRGIRPGEEDGRDYFFISREMFEQRIREGDFLEHAEYSGNLYGTPKHWVEKQMNEGRDVLLEIEVKGALQVMEKIPDCVSIFIEAPDFEELEKRLRGRGTETEEVIAKRLARAREEAGYASLYHYRIVNREIDDSYAQLKAIYLKETGRA